VMSERLVRLGVLRDRVARGTTQESDLLESLDLADAAILDLNEARQQASERNGWKDLITENTTHLANAIEVIRHTEPHLAEIAKTAKQKASFYRMINNKKVVITLAILVFLLVGGFAGFLSFQSVNLVELIPVRTTTYESAPSEIRDGGE